MRSPAIVSDRVRCLVAGAELSGAGLDVTLQDAHTSAGECAGTFYTIFTTI